MSGLTAPPYFHYGGGVGPIIADDVDVDRLKVGVAAQCRTSGFYVSWKED